MKSQSRYVLMAIAIMCLPFLSASAQTNAISVSNTTGEPLAKTDATFGWSFTVNSDIDVVDLGVFDSSQNGLTDSHQVGIWNSSGTLLISATVPSGTGATLDDQFRVVSVSSTELFAGQKYFIGTLYTTLNDPLLLQGDATNFATASQITYDNPTVAVLTTTLTDPTENASPSPGIFGPNFEFEAATSPVPEPGSFVLLGTGMLGLAGVLRRRWKS